MVAVPADAPGNLADRTTSGATPTDGQIKQGLVEAKDALVLAVRVDTTTSNTARISVAVPDNAQAGVASASSTQTAVLVRTSRTSGGSG